MVKRRSLLGFMFAAFSSFGVAWGRDPLTGEVDLKQTLIFGLRPRTPKEEAFVTSVVAYVDAKQLPLEPVIATYRWARDKRPYPFPYFERAMRARARALGVAL